MKTILTNFILLAIVSFTTYGQDTVSMRKGVIGTFHTKNKIYNGLSFGFASTMADSRNVKTNGLRLEIPGIGFLSFMGNGFPNSKEPFELTNYKFSEVVNGLNISTGSWCDCNYNGLTIAAVGQYGKLGQGFSFAGGWNIIDKQNGLQIALIANSSYYMNGVQISAFNYINTGSGLQIGIFNESKNFRGIQIGLWNVNQKRKLPLINWNFKE